jgi:hypothetical protein
MKECPYGYEGDELPCKISPDDYNCRVCATVELTQTLQDMNENGIKMFFIPMEGEDLGQLHHRKRKLKTKQY